jgi:hypothetical protein
MASACGPLDTLHMRRAVATRRNMVATAQHAVRLFRQVLGAWLLRAGWASHDGTDRSHPWAAAYVASLLLVLVNFVCVPALVVSRCAAPWQYARSVS